MIYQVVVSDIQKYLEASPSIKTWINLSAQGIVSNLINLVLVVAFVVFLFLLLLGGIQWITSGGDKESLAKAKGKITSAIIGIIIVICAWAILSLIRSFFGLEKITSTPPSPQPADCLSVCRQTSCQGYNSFCYKNCRCICDARGQMWYYNNPWCDADTHQYYCQNSAKTPDPKGKISKINLNCPGD